ncbi:hypothetical protein JCM8547_001771 [Rhodosporidiobolus lusitaniae]
MSGELPHLVAELLSDYSQPAPLSQALVGLVTSDDPTTQLLLASALHQLLSSLLSPSSPSAPSSSSQPQPQPAQLAAFLHDSLFVPLEAASGAGEADERKASLADAFIDVVWQLDQELDVQVPLLLRKQKAEQAGIGVGEGETMQVDGGAGAGKTADDREAVAAAILSARERLGLVVKTLIDHHDLPQQAVLERLELSLLPHLRLITDINTYSRLEVRSRTALYYKQQKFNLLREESEGYSKLVVEFLTNMGPSHSSVTGKSQEREEERRRRAVSVNDKVKNLIGNFDLDPSRTLDVFLDTFSDQVVEHYQFFLDFLTHSPWAPKGKKKPSSPTNGVAGEKGKGKATVNVGVEGEEGSDTIAQILGFKFAFYQGQDAPSVPNNLYLATALLIWHGFVKLTDIWAHLSPSDEDLLKIKSQYEAEQSALARSVGGANALAMAGALVDDEAPVKPTSSSSTSAAASTSAAPPPPPRPLPNQKLALLHALLTLGDLPHALFILSQYPFLVASSPDLADLLLRLLSVSLEPAYGSISVLRGEGEQYREELTAWRPKVSVDAKGEKKSVLPARKWELTGEAFPNSRRDWTFFFPAWKERAPKAGDWEEVLELLEKVYLPLTRVNVSRDMGVYTKVCRILRADLSTEPSPSHPRFTRWLDILRLYLIPGLSLLSNHASAALTLWDVLSLFPLETRFALYGEWKNSHYRRIPALEVRKAEAERDVKSLLRRLSTENVKKLGKTFARVAHTNPMVIFAVALNQVMSYDNLIAPVVEAARYLTPLGYDCLAWSILEALSGDRPKTKEDGTSVAMWLQGLATFTGALYRRWPAMSTTLWVILQYLVNQLVASQSKDLVVLRELIGRMTAIEPFADLSDAQVLSLAGGKHLRSEVFMQTEVGHASKRGQLEALAKAKGRLAEALLDKGLAVPLLVNIAIQRQACLKTDAHLKSLGALFDQNHAILFQFTELLHAITTPSDLASLVPPVTQLLSSFSLDPGVAFDISRPKLRALLKEHDEKEAAELAAQAAEKKKGLLAKLAREKEKAGSASPSTAAAAAAVKAAEEAVVEAVEGEVKMEVDGRAEAAKEESGTPPPPEGKKEPNGAANGDVAMADGSTPPASSPAPVVSPWHPGLTDVISSVSNLLPESARTSIGAPFFVTFWQLTLYDILFPKERYEAETARLKLMQREVASAAAPVKPDERDRFIKQIVALATTLMDEATKHMAARNVVTRRLMREKAAWFTGTVKRADRIRLADEMLQHCIQPRARLSLPDAVYSHQLIRRLHALNTPGFHTALLYDRLLTSQISPILYSCTENEARNYGRFLYDVLGDLFKWHKDKSAFEEEAIGTQLLGFSRNGTGEKAAGKPTHYSHADFQSILVKWHGNMIDGFVESFESAEYMHIKNSILVLTKIAPYFPLDFKQGEKLEKAVGELLVKEKREDLTILAQGYKAVITKSRKQWINRPPKEAPKPKEANKPKETPKASPAPSITPAASKAPTEAPSPEVTTKAPPTAPSASRRPSSSAPATSTSSSSRTAPSTAAEPPKGPKQQHNLPTRPSRDDPKPAASSANSTSSAALPARPPGGRQPSNVSGTTASTAALTDSNAALPTRPGGGSASSVDADKLRKDALASKRATPTVAPMDPPAAPSSSRDNKPSTSSSSRPASRAPTPPGRASDADRDRDRRSTREDDRSKRERSVESTHSSRSARDTRDSRDSRSERDRDRDRDRRDRERRDDRDRDGRRIDDRDRDRRPADERDSRDSGSSRRDDRSSSKRESDRRDDRDRDRRGDDRDRRSDDRDRRDSRPSSAREDDRDRRREDDRYKSSSSSSSARREDDRRRNGSERERESSGRTRTSSGGGGKPTKEEEAREAEKEKERERDAQREKERERDAQRERERDEAKRRPQPSRNSSSLPAPRGLPARPAADIGTGDRLRPAPADRNKDSNSTLERARATLPGASPSKPTSPTASRASPADDAAPLTIKGGARGRSIFDQALSASGESSRKRSAPPPERSLADRLGGGEKRPRTDEPSRGGGGGRDGDRDRGGSGGGGGGRRRRG